MDQVQRWHQYRDAKGGYEKGKVVDWGYVRLSRRLKGIWRELTHWGLGQD